MNIIALDVHSATFTMAIQNDRGKLMRVLSRETSGENLIEEVCKVSGKRWLVVEESHLAQWVHTTVKPYVEKLTVCDPRHNRWIAEDDFADDRTSAMKLGELAAMDKLKEVYHPDDEMAELRGVFLHYYDLNGQITRFRNKLKATYRQVGFAAPGQRIYAEKNREEWLEKLKSYPYLLRQAKDLFKVVDCLVEMKEQSRERMIELARKAPSFELLLDIPGIGEVIASGYIAIIVTPDRFSKKNKLWRYAGFGNKHHESDNVVYKKRASRTGNRVLKWLVRQQFQSAVHCSKRPNRFKSQHAALRARGLSKRDARRVVCRSLLSVVRAVWMKMEAYREEPSS